MPPIAAQPPPSQLTHHQLAALQCVAEGMTERQIGLQLGLETATVRKHLAHARERLGARSLTHAVALAIAAGLVQVDERSDG